MGSSDGMPDEGWRRRKGAPARFRFGWPDHIISAVIKARDAFAHSAPIVGGIEGGAALHWAPQGLNWLLRYHALTEIGFETEQARERVLTNYTFVQEAERLREVLGLTNRS